MNAPLRFALVALSITLVPCGTALAAAPVPSGFREITLGMGLDAVKAALAKDTYFDYRGDPDVSMLLKPEDNLIECGGFSYISRAYFQFHDKVLYTIILVLNPEEISFYTLYTHLVGKYGQPASLSPSAVVWASDRYQLSLERPLSIKYIDLKVFDQLKEAGKMQESDRQISREAFLSQF